MRTLVLTTLTLVGLVLVISATMTLTGCASNRNYEEAQQMVDAIHWGNEQCLAGNQKACLELQELFLMYAINHSGGGAAPPPAYPSISSCSGFGRTSTCINY